MQEKKLWQARFQEANSKNFELFNASILCDCRLYEQDIQGSLAHAEMLAKEKIISQTDFEKIQTGLLEILDLVKLDPLKWANENLINEDIHLAIEKALTDKIGEAGKKLHTARSRNDQVSTDLRLWLMHNSENIKIALRKISQTLINNAKRDIDIIIVGYTHLQQAQSLSLGHYWLAYLEKFKRDISRLEDCVERLRICPLGSGAIAGTTFKIDRDFTSAKLGFVEPSKNSLDAVSDRDFVCEYEFVLSMIMLHLSSIAEEMIIWASQEFSYISIPDSLSSGSSMMPQKKNPDIPELVRGKTGRVIASLNAMMITLKALPLAYNKDLQEDKELLFMAHDTTLNCLNIMQEFIAGIEMNKDQIAQKLIKSYISATDIADYLSKKGLAFREAYQITGALTRHAIENNKYFSNLELSEYQSFSDLFDKDIYEFIKPESMVDLRNNLGGTSREQVKMQINEA